MITMLVLLASTLSVAHIGEQQAMHSRDSVKPRVVQMRTLPSSHDSGGGGLNVIHAPLPENPSDTLKKHQKLPVYKPKPVLKKHKPQKGI